MTGRPQDTTGMEMNRYWRAHQPKPATEPRPAPTAEETVSVIHPDTPRQIPVSAIDCEPVKIDNHTVQILRHQIETGKIAPVTVRQDGDRFVLLDGTRRVSVALNLGMQEISAIVLDAGTPYSKPEKPPRRSLQEQKPVRPEPRPAPERQDQQDRAGPAECKECTVRVQCKAVLALWHQKAPRPDLARAWCQLIDQNAGGMLCLSQQLNPQDREDK
jgi:hypothetical protein